MRLNIKMIPAGSVVAISFALGLGATTATEHSENGQAAAHAAASQPSESRRNGDRP